MDFISWHAKICDPRHYTLSSTIHPFYDSTCIYLYTDENGIGNWIAIARRIHLFIFQRFSFLSTSPSSMVMGFVQRGRITGPKNKRLNFQRSVAIHLNYEVLAHPRWFLRGYSMIDYTDRTVFIVSTTWKDRAQPLYTICIITNSLRSVCIITWVDVTKPSPCCESVLSRNFVFTYFKKKERKKESSLCDLSITVKVMYDTITCQRRLRRRFVGFRMSPEELTVYSFSLECCCGT